MGDGTKDDSYFPPSRPADGDVAHAGSRDLQQLWAYRGHRRSDAKSRRHDLCLSKPARAVDRGRNWRCQSSFTWNWGKGGDGAAWEVFKSLALRGKGESQQGLLLHFMRFGAAGGRAGAGATFYREHGALSCNAAQAWKHVEQCSHVGGLLLHPDDIALLAVAFKFGDQIFLGKWIELLQEHDGGCRPFSLAALGAEFMSDLSCADQDALGVADLGVG